MTSPRAMTLATTLALLLLLPVSRTDARDAGTSPPTPTLAAAGEQARQGHTDAAIAAYKAIIAAHPKQPEAYNNLAVLYAAQGDLAAARRVLEQALATNPRYQTVYSNLSRIYLALARDSYDKALQLGKPAQRVALTGLHAPVRPDSEVQDSDVAGDASSDTRAAGASGQAVATPAPGEPVAGQPGAAQTDAAAPAARALRASLNSLLAVVASAADPEHGSAAGGVASAPLRVARTDKTVPPARTDGPGHEGVDATKTAAAHPASERATEGLTPPASGNPQTAVAQTSASNPALASAPSVHPVVEPGQEPSPAQATGVASHAAVTPVHSGTHTRTDTAAAGHALPATPVGVAPMPPPPPAKTTAVTASLAPVRVAKSEARPPVVAKHAHVKQAQGPATAGSSPAPAEPVVGLAGADIRPSPSPAPLTRAPALAEVPVAKPATLAVASPGSATPPPATTQVAGEATDEDSNRAGLSAGPAPAAAKTVLLDWARAWSARNVSRYLSFYATHFQPDDGMSRAVWAAQRKPRLRKPAFIEVTLSDMKIEPIGPGRVRVTLVQRYRSDRYRDRTRKAFVLVAEHGHWRIFNEQTLAVLAR